MGEALDRLEEFRADGMASRILGFGDIVGLMKDFEEVVDEEKAERDAKRMLEGQFTFDDFLEQLSMLQQVGPLQDMLEKLPFFADSVPEGFQVDEKEFDRIEAIIYSMTPEERRRPELIKGSRRLRIAKGSGTSVQQVNQLVKQFGEMRKLMKGMQAGKMPDIGQLMRNR